MGRRVLLLCAIAALAITEAKFVGRIDDCDDHGDPDACAAVRKSEFPPECGDLVALTKALRDGSFTPSAPKRWESVKDAMWQPAPNRSALVPAEERCDVIRESAANLTPERFKNQYHEKLPVIITGATDPSLFTDVTQKRVLLYCMGDFDVTLSTANKNSYDKYESTLRHYLTNLISPQTLEASGVGSKYFFGDNRHAEWESVFQHYAQPTQYIWSHVSLSFGVGGSGSGVPFHTHGAVFADVMHGEKRWYLQAPGPEPRFDPDESSLRWTTFIFPTFTDDERSKMMDCVVKPGEFIYIPGHWHHATLNIGESVFMSAFV